MKVLPVLLTICLFSSCCLYMKFDESRAYRKYKQELVRYNQELYRLVEKAYKTGFPIVIQYVGMVKNSDGAVRPVVYFRNVQNKSIKYAYLTLVPYNNVNDPVQCSFNRNRSHFTLRVTGPIVSSVSNDRDRFVPFIWINHDITYVKLVSVRVIYMDNSHQLPMQTGPVSLNIPW